MAKFHINDNGTAGKCSAKISCPFGDLEDQHWDSAEDARAAYEQSQAAWGPIMAAQRKTTLTPTDFGDAAKELYNSDPDWSWDRNNVQKFVSWDNVSADRKLQLITAAQGLATFVNAFERDVPLSALLASFEKLSIRGAGIDTES